MPTIQPHQTGTTTSGVFDTNGLRRSPEPKKFMSAFLDPQWIQLISQQLYEHDPMNTCCNGNEGMEDEYLGEAKDIVRHLCDGLPLQEALIQTFDDWFWVGCLLEPRRHASADALLSSLSTAVPEGCLK